MADARDLKSRVPLGTCGFDSRSGYLYSDDLRRGSPQAFYRDGRIVTKAVASSGSLGLSEGVGKLRLWDAGKSPFSRSIP